VWWLRSFSKVDDGFLQKDMKKSIFVLTEKRLAIKMRPLFCHLSRVKIDLHLKW
jgi:hypothetical protein